MYSSDMVQFKRRYSEIAKGHKQQTSGQSSQQSVDKAQSPGDEGKICPKPSDWCAYPGATNEPKECGGQPGHFCHDIYGKSGFAPCDAKRDRSWGTVQCERQVSEENVKRSQRRRARRRGALGLRLRGRRRRRGRRGRRPGRLGLGRHPVRHAPDD